MKKIEYGKYGNIIGTGTCIYCGEMVYKRAKYVGSREADRWFHWSCHALLWPEGKPPNEIWETIRKALRSIRLKRFNAVAC